MTRKHLFTRAAIIGVITVHLGACGGDIQKKIEDTFPGREAEYKSSRSMPRLEIPPDLTTPATSDTMAVPAPDAAGGPTYTEYSAAGQVPVQQRNLVLPENPDVRVAGSGDKRWLIIKATPAQVWPKVREFWLQNGLIIKMEDPGIGIMETDWAENRADIPKSFLRRMLEKITTSVYSAATRDKYRVRLERGEEEGTTELYLSHRGAEEVSQTDTYVWQPRPSDPELEAEMLNRMLVYFGVGQDKANRLLASKSPRPDRAHIVRERDGSAALTVRDGFSRAWRRTGLALDRVGFTVEDRDRSRGLFYVRYVDPFADSGEEKGFFSKLKFWGKDKDKGRGSASSEFLISLQEQEASSEPTTRVLVLDTEGRQEKSATADRILSLLHEQLK